MIRSSYEKQTFKTQQKYTFCQLKSELIYSEKQRQKNARFMNDVLKTRDIKY